MQLKTSIEWKRWRSPQIMLNVQIINDKDSYYHLKNISIIVLHPINFAGFKWTVKRHYADKQIDHNIPPLTEHIISTDISGIRKKYGENAKFYFVINDIHETDKFTFRDIITLKNNHLTDLYSMMF